MQSENPCFQGGDFQGQIRNISSFLSLHRAEAGSERGKKNAGDTLDLYIVSKPLDSPIAVAPRPYFCTRSDYHVLLHSGRVTVVRVLQPPPDPLEENTGAVRVR